MEYTQVTPDRLQILLDEWGAGRATSVEPLGGLANSNFRVARDGAPPLVLKIYEEHSVEAAERLVDQAAWLSERGVPTPASLAGPDGRRVWVRGDRAWTLQPFVEGHDLEPSPEALRSLGCGLARLHLAGTPPGLTEGFGMGFSLFDDLFVRADRDDAWSPFLRQLRSDARQLRRDIPADLPAGAIHGDLFPDNVRFEGSELVAILDLEELCRDWLALDLAMAFVGCGWVDGQPMADLWGALRSGYESIRPLTDAESSALPHLHHYATSGIAAWRYGQFVMNHPELGLGSCYEEMAQRRSVGLPF
jgi:homoserine kinase type II